MLAAKQLPLWPGLGQYEGCWVTMRRQVSIRWDKLSFKYGSLTPKGPGQFEAHKGRRSTETADHIPPIKLGTDTGDVLSLMKNVKFRYQMTAFL